MTEPLDLPFPEPSDRSARAASLRSRQAVHDHDRDGWLGLFADDGVVQDPVGVSGLDPTGLGHRGADARAAFWDANIGPNPVRMDVYASYAGGDEVANVVTITTTLPDGAKAVVDCVAVYRVDGSGDVVSLRAFWELDQMRFEAAPA